MKLKEQRREKKMKREKDQAKQQKGI